MPNDVETLPPLSTRFEGMPGTMQGGYVAALAAGERDGPIRVRIRRPLKVGDVLERSIEGDTWELHRDGELVMTGQPTELHVSEPIPVDPTLARAATDRPPAFPLPFSTCIGCGERADGLGFRIRPVGDGRQMVGAWTPSPQEALPNGRAPREHVWTVIDCITSWAVFTDPPRSGTGGAVTGNIAVEFRSDLQAGQEYIFQSWRERDDERSIICGGAIHDTDGSLIVLCDQELIRTDGWGMEIPTEPLC